MYISEKVSVFLQKRIDEHEEKYGQPPDHEQKKKYQAQIELNEIFSLELQTGKVGKMQMDLFWQMYSSGAWKDGSFGDSYETFKEFAQNHIYQKARLGDGFNEKHLQDLGRIVAKILRSLSVNPREIKHPVTGETVTVNARSVIDGLPYEDAAGKKRIKVTDLNTVKRLSQFYPDEDGKPLPDSGEWVSRLGVDNIDDFYQKMAETLFMSRAAAKPIIGILNSTDGDGTQTHKKVAVLTFPGVHKVMRDGEKSEHVYIFSGLNNEQSSVLHELVKNHTEWQTQEEE